MRPSYLVSVHTSNHDVTVVATQTSLHLNGHKLNEDSYVSWDTVVTALNQAQADIAEALSFCEFQATQAIDRQFQSDIGK